MNKKILCLIVLLFLSITISTEKTIVTKAITFEDVNVVVFTASGQAYDEYFWVCDYLEKWGATITVAAYTEEIISVGAPVITTDVLISDIEDITIYDAIFIPGGLIADKLIGEQKTLDLLNEANDNGIVIAGICSGTLVIAAAGLVDGRYFATWPTIIADLEAAGGTHVPGEVVVTDNNIITASPPNYLEVSYAIAFALGYNYDCEVSFELLENKKGTTITLDFSNKAIFSNVTVDIYLKDNKGTLSLKESIKASLDENYENYEVVVEDLASGDYCINIIVINVFDRVTIYENALEFNIPNNSQGLFSFEINLCLFSLLFLTAVFKRSKLL